jgi:hypothetical protein
MDIENQNQQSTVGKMTSGYLKVTGHTNIVGSIFLFIIGGVMTLIGTIIALISKNFFPLIFSAIGVGLILLGRFNLKWSKRMREGKYYQVGKGWVEPK